MAKRQSIEQEGAEAPQKNEKRLRDRGPAGPAGPAGPQGPPGPAGPKMSRADVLSLVEDQFGEIRKELAVQLTRMGQIQTQLDQIHKMLKKLVQEP